MKKGFDLIEVAIVMLIFGVISGFTIKGKNLIETSKDVKEAAKLKNLATSVYTYYSTANNLTPVINESEGVPYFLSPQYLENGGYLTNSDYKSEFEETGEFFYSFFSYEDAGKFYKEPRGYLLRNVKGNDKTINITNSLAISNLQTLSYTVDISKTLPLRVICVIEKYLDDGKADSGDAKITRAYGSKGYPVELYNELISVSRCSDASGKFFSQDFKPEYSWRVF